MPYGLASDVGIAYLLNFFSPGEKLIMLLSLDRATHIKPPASTAIPTGLPPIESVGVGISNSSNVCVDGANLPSLLLFCSVNQILSEASAAISTGLLDGVGITYSVIGPSAENTTLVKNTILTTIPINQNFHLFIG